MILEHTITITNPQLLNHYLIELKNNDVDVMIFEDIQKMFFFISYSNNTVPGSII